MDSKLKVGIIIMIVIIVLIFLVSTICPNAHRFSIGNMKKVKDEKVPSQKSTAPKLKVESFCLSKFITETVV